MEKIHCFSVLFFLSTFWIMNKASSIDIQKLFYDENPENSIVKYMKSKKYFPSVKKIKALDNQDKILESDTNLILSKLSDNDIIAILSKQPMKEDFSLDELNVDKSHNSKNDYSFKLGSQTNTMDSNSPVFRLEHKIVNNNFKSERDGTYEAVQKLLEVMKKRQQDPISSSYGDEDTQRELLFDVLVAQLKNLCCGKERQKRLNTNDYVSIPSSPNKNFDAFSSSDGNFKATISEVAVEHMFIVINDDIETTRDSDGVVPVDPNSLDENSSVLLLGPLSKSLTDSQLHKVMSRLTNELVKPQYSSLLEQISDGTIKHKNIQVIKSLVSGPNTRRYIKPHRCNFQSKLARIHGQGPRWVICTGYININRPSLYD